MSRDRIEKEAGLREAKGLSIVSVIIPAYNRRKFLREAIKSVVTQAYRPIELIVVDDGSETPIQGVVNEVASHEGKVDIVYHRQENCGPADARNKGLELAHGEMIAFLDSDDRWFPEMLETMVSFLKVNTGVDLVCGGWNMIDEEGQPTSGTFLPSGLQRKVDQDFLRSIILEGLFPLHSVLCRKRCFDLCGNFNTGLLAYEDWELWVRMAAGGCRIAFLDIPVAQWRQHASQQRSDVSSQAHLAIRQVIESLYSHDKIRERCGDLRIHAEISMLLMQAEYYSNKGLQKQSEMAIKKATELYRKAPFKKEVIPIYDKKTRRLPSGKEFRVAVRRSMPRPFQREYYARKDWLRLGKDMNGISLGRGIRALTKFVANNPMWCLRNSPEKARRLFGGLAGADWARTPMLSFLVGRVLKTLNPPVLVMSLPRSGSSWVGDIMSHASNALYLREPITQSHQQSGARGTLIEIDCEKPPTLYGKLADLAFSGIPAFAANIVTSPERWNIFRRTKCRVVVKEVNPLALRFFVKHYQPKVVFLIRHPAAVALSFYKLGWMENEDAQFCSDKPCRSAWEGHGARQGFVLRFAMETLKSYPYKIIVTYEEICENPIAQFHKIFKFTDLNWDKRVQNHIRKLSYGGNEPNSFGTRRISKDMIFSWRDKIGSNWRLKDLYAGYRRFELPWYDSPQVW